MEVVLYEKKVTDSLLMRQGDCHQALQRPQQRGLHLLAKYQGSRQGPEPADS